MLNNEKTRFLVQLRALLINDNNKMFNVSRPADEVNINKIYSVIFVYLLEINEIFDLLTFAARDTILNSIRMLQSKLF